MDLMEQHENDRQRFSERSVELPDYSSGWPVRKYSRIVTHGGRKYVASTTMSEIFRAHALDTISRGDTELVPLLHKDGIDLLLIGPATIFEIVAIDSAPVAAITVVAAG